MRTGKRPDAGVGSLMHQQRVLRAGAVRAVRTRVKQLARVNESVTRKYIG